MILLTDEESFNLVQDLKTTYEEDLGIVAKAQLKKVVEYLTENDLLHHSEVHYDSAHTGFVEGCEACALLKEIE